MAGGQGLTGGQGSVTQSSSVALIGAAFASFTGNVGTALTGEASSLAIGSVLSGPIVSLRSRKVGGGTATFALSGSQFSTAIGALDFVYALSPAGQAGSFALGVFGKQRSRALTGLSVLASSGSLSVLGAADADWIAISTAAGVEVANRLDTQLTIDDWKLNDSTGDHMTLDTSLKPHPSANGSLKHAVLNTDGAASGQFSVPFPAKGTGSIFWYSYRVHAPATAVYQSWPPSNDPSNAHKLSILSRDANGSAPTGSNQVNELVTQSNENAGMISGYWQDGIVTANPVQVPFSSAVNATDFRDQPSIDRGANPLVGTNPDTGAAWSTNEQERARYGTTYGARSTPGAANYKSGFGDPFSGGFRQYPDEWIQVTGRVEYLNPGSTGNRWTTWAARDQQPYELLWDKQNIQIGNGPAYNGLNLLPYTTNRTSGGRKVSNRTNSITGATILVCGLTTPIGDGVLEYNAATQRFRWHGAAESFGSARGFSEVNGIFTINVIASGESYLVVEVDPALLPTSGTISDTVTIANGRNDTQVNYSDAVISSQAINARGGYAPTGVNKIADAAAAMAPGTWLQMTGSNLPSGLNIFAFQGGASSISTYYSNAMAWDSAAQKIYWIGSDHPLAPIFCQYDANTNAWTLNTPPPAAQFPVRPTHGYNCNAFDTLRRKFYFDVAHGTSNIARWDGGGSWTTFNYGSLVVYKPGAVALFYHEALDRLLHYQLENLPSGILVSFNPANGAFQTLATNPNLNETGDPHNFGIYSRIHQIGWFGGGNGTLDTFKINGSGIISKVTNAIPGALGSMGPGGGNAPFPVYNPVNGNFVVIKDSTTWYDFAPLTDTWTAKGGTIPMLTTTAPAGHATIAVTIPEYGVTAFVKCPSGFVNAQMWLYKHSA